MVGSGRVGSGRRAIHCDPDDDADAFLLARPEKGTNVLRLGRSRSAIFIGSLHPNTKKIRSFSPLSFIIVGVEKHIYIYISTDDTHKRRARESPRRMRIRVLGSRDGPRVQEAIGCGVGREGRLFTHREAIEGSGRGAALLRAGGGGQ